LKFAIFTRESAMTPAYPINPIVRGSLVAPTVQITPISAARDSIVHCLQPFSTGPGPKRS